MLPIITRTDAMYYIANARLYREEKDPKMKQMWMETMLAQTVIRRTLGDAWWEGASEEIDSWVKGVKRELPRRHPLSAFMTGGAEKVVQPERWGQILRLGADLLTLLDQPEANESLEQKLPELRSGSFFDTWFEISVAGLLIRKGMRAKLIPSSNKVKRPDIEVQGQFGRVEVECKARGKLSTEERWSEEVYRRKSEARISGVENLVDNALTKFPNPESPTLVAVSIETPRTPAGTLELKLLRSSLESKFIRSPNLSGAMFITERSERDPTTDIVELHGELHALKSQNATHVLPDDFFRVLVDENIDSRPKMLYLTSYAMAH